MGSMTIPSHLSTGPTGPTGRDGVTTFRQPCNKSNGLAWDRDGRHLYFLASTDLALASGWANTSSMQAQPTYAPYVMVLRAEDREFDFRAGDRLLVADHQITRDTIVTRFGGFGVPN